MSVCVQLCSVRVNGSPCMVDNSARALYTLRQAAAAAAAADRILAATPAAEAHVPTPITHDLDVINNRQLQMLTAVQPWADPAHHACRGQDSHFRSGTRPDGPKPEAQRAQSGVGFFGR